MNFLDRNEFNFKPSQKVIDAVRNFDPQDLCFYTRIYDQGKKSVVSVRLSEIYGVPEDRNVTVPAIAIIRQHANTLSGKSSQE